MVAGCCCLFVAVNVLMGWFSLKQSNVCVVQLIVGPSNHGRVVVVVHIMML